MPTRPFIEEQSSKPLALIASHTTLLARELSNRLQQQQIATQLFYLPTAAGDNTLYPQFPQEKSAANLTQLKSTGIDYFFYLYPSLGAVNPSEHERFFHSLPTTTKIIVIDNYRYQSRTDVLLGVLKDKDFRLVFLSDPIGPFVPPQVTNPALKAITQVFNHQNIELDKDGQNLLYPTFTADIVEGIIKATFNSGTQGQTFYLSTLEPTSQIDFAQLLRPLSADLLDFSPTQEFSPHSSSSPILLDTDKVATTQAQLSWVPNTDLQTSLNTTLTLSKEWFKPDNRPQPLNSVTTPYNLPLTEGEKLLPSATREGVKSAKTLFQALPKTQTPLKPLQRNPLKVPGEFFKPRNRHPNITFSPKLIIAFIIILILSLPPMFLVTTVSRGSQQLTDSYLSLEQGNHQQAKELAIQAKKTLTSARSLLQAHRTIIFFGFQDKFKQYDQFLDLGGRLTTVIINSSESAVSAQELYEVVAGRSQKDFLEANSKLKTSLDALYSQLSLVQASIENLNIDTNPTFSDISNLNEKLTIFRQNVELGVDIVNILPNLINSPQPKTYLVLIQNNSELRPTGGFIAAYSLATFTNGRLTDIQTQDIYTADSQLGGEVIPPEAIVTYLGEENWYLRDSNWSPHFPSAALQAEWFLNKELGRSVDGVVGINLFVLSQFLQATGPLQIAGQNHPITAGNLFETAEYGSQIDFNDPSTQKNEVLVPIAENIFTNILSGNVKLITLASALNQSLTAGHLTIFSNQATNQAFIESKNWSGSLIDPGCPIRFNQENCTSETFAIMEANVGVNRSNYFLSRRIDHQVKIGDQGQLDHTITVSYQNSAPNDSWPAGRYKTYTRLYAPLHSQPISATLGGQPLTLISSIPDLDIGLQEIVYVYDIPATSSRDLVISLRSSQIINILNPAATLSINWQKQSGTTPDPLSIGLSYPDSLAPTQINQPASVSPGKLSTSTQLSQDQTLAIEFASQ